MRPSKSAIRALVTAVTLLLSVLLAADCATAQVGPVDERVAVSAERVTASDADHTDPAPDGCRVRHNFRNLLSVPAPVTGAACVCGCDSRTNRERDVIVPITGSEAVPRTRSVELPLLHQVIRR